MKFLWLLSTASSCSRWASTSTPYIKQSYNEYNVTLQQNSKTMEAYNCSSSSAYSQSQQDSGDKVEYVKASNSYQSSLHAVRKAPLKPWKKPIAPVPPAGPKVYKVDPVNFRELVQRLTGASECQLQRLKRVAPPPLNVTPISCFSRVSRAVASLASKFETPEVFGLWDGIEFLLDWVCHHIFISGVLSLFLVQELFPVWSHAQFFRSFRNVASTIFMYYLVFSFAGNG